MPHPPRLPRVWPQQAAASRAEPGVAILERPCGARDHRPRPAAPAAPGPRMAAKARSGRRRSTYQTAAGGPGAWRQSHRLPPSWPARRSRGDLRAALWPASTTRPTAAQRSTQPRRRRPWQRPGPGTARNAVDQALPRSWSMEAKQSSILPATVQPIERRCRPRSGAGRLCQHRRPHGASVAEVAMRAVTVIWGQAPADDRDLPPARRSLSRASRLRPQQWPVAAGGHGGCAVGVQAGLNLE